MLKFKIESDKLGTLKFRADISEDLKENLIVKRLLFESKIVKSNKKYLYIIPIKYLLPVIQNVPSELLIMDEESIDNFLEFSDEYDEIFYYAAKATSGYMKKWREESCPRIFKVIIEKDTMKVSKEIAFERLI